MKVILIKDHPDTGRKGEIVDVKDGFAVNFLIPRGFAVAATDHAVEQLKQKKQRKKEKLAEKASALDKMAEKVKGQTYRVVAEVSSGGRLYGSLEEKEILDQLDENWKVSDKDLDVDLGLAQPIKDTGKYPLDVTFKAGDKTKTVDIILEVVSK